MQLKNKYRKGDKINMCQALLDIRQEGIDYGIQQFILDNQEENVPKERILVKLVRHFKLTEQQAEEYYNKFSE